MAPEMMNMQGAWISCSETGQNAGELTVIGDTVIWSSGTKAKLVAQQEKFWLTSESGKRYLSADVVEHGNDELILSWTDGTIWSRKPLMKVPNAEHKKVQCHNQEPIDLESKLGSSGSRAPKVFQKVPKGTRRFSMKDGNKARPPQAKATLADVQGKWTIDSGDAQVEVVVCGSNVSWSTGSKAAITVHNEQQFWLTSESGKIYLTGEMASQGGLYWKNGSVWKRPAEEQE